MDTSVQLSFRGLGVSEAFVNDLAKAGLSSPTPIQAQAIPPALDGRDVIGCRAHLARTATGARRGWHGLDARCYLPHCRTDSQRDRARANSGGDVHQEGRGRDA